MDFETVVKTLLQLFEQQRIRYGTIGAFALGALGVVRTTTDIDFLVHRDDLRRLHEALQQLGYQRHVHTENVSQYRHPQDVWGSVDILHAFRSYALGMLERARPFPVFGGTQTISVLQPEDVIGLKVQAMANDPSRATQETADIESLMATHGSRLDWDRIQEFYDVFDLGAEAKRLRAQFGHAQ
jgi:hypothetical protein